MKYYIAVLRPNHGKGNKMEWCYFTGFGCTVPRSAHELTRPILHVSKHRADALFFDENDTFFLYETQQKIVREHNEQPQTFTISDKKLFELKLKDE